MPRLCWPTLLFPSNHLSSRATAGCHGDQRPAWRVIRGLDSLWLLARTHRWKSWICELRNEWQQGRHLINTVLVTGQWVGVQCHRGTKRIFNSYKDCSHLEFTRQHPLVWRRLDSFSYKNLQIRMASRLSGDIVKANPLHSVSTNGQFVKGKDAFLSLPLKRWWMTTVLCLCKPPKILINHHYI